MVARLSRARVLQVDDDERNHVRLQVTCEYDRATRELISTHSGELLAETDIRDIRRLARTPDGIKAFRVGSNVLSPEETRKFNYHIRRARGELLFARCWLLVEGETDAWVYPAAAQALGLNLHREGARVVEFKQSDVGMLAKVANALGISWYFVGDDDQNRVKDEPKLKQNLTFENLNENQRRAVEWKDGPLLVLAGPGSGKTGVLTLRVARLIEEDEDASALALTFTNKAAAEMRERVDDLLGEHSERGHLCTFHSFATDVLGQHGSHLGIRPDFQPLARDEDRIAILEEVIRDLPDGGEELPSDRQHVLELIDRLFSESYVGQGDSASLASTPDWLPGLFRRYCDALVTANRLDFGSLLHFATRLLRDKPAVARVVRLGWTHVCVDEFQDTNRAQYDLLRLLAPARRHNLFVVADDDQIIYQWNGASPRRFRDLRSDYDVRTLELPESYRCPPAIVALANRLVARNTRRISDRRTVAVRDHDGAYPAHSHRFASSCVL